MTAKNNNVDHHVAAIDFTDAHFSYGAKQPPVLSDLNVNVPLGSIYGLLGPSGCGKTTLLQCIVGRQRLKSGDIKVFGARPGDPKSGVPGPRVGLMPQELALYNEFTISVRSRNLPVMSAANNAILLGNFELLWLHFRHDGQ